MLSISIFMFIMFGEDRSADGMRPFEQQRSLTKCLGEIAVYTCAGLTASLRRPGIR
jgi:hypothetical protein